MDAYLMYASSALVLMGGLAYALAVVFRKRRMKLESVSKGVSPRVFSRTYVVFDPYGRKTLWHRVLAFLPFIPIIGGFGIAALLLVIIESGLLLTLIITIAALSLIVVEESLEAEAESKILIKALEEGVGLAEGDVKLIEVTTKMLPRLSLYYFGLSVLLVASAIVLPFVWSSALWYFAMFIGYVLQLSTSAGPASWVLGIFAYAMLITAFFVLATVAKNRFFTIRGERAVA